ncbi:translation initiation factor IF-2-like isoform X1 [Takifugu flavidus]|nr:translation initiation factor IF-2-like isoform X1 [Takifugu flavidus]
MFCRQAWKRAAPLARRVFKPAPRNGAPVRLMASGLPGGSFNTTYFVLCGGGLTAALVYAYKTINSDTERYESRLAGMGSTDKGQFEATPAAEPAPAEVAEVIPESVSAPPEEAAEVSADPVVWSEEAAAEAVSEEPAEAPGTAAEASEGAEGAAPPETRRRPTSVLVRQRSMAAPLPPAEAAA